MLARWSILPVDFYGRKLGIETLCAELTERFDKVVRPEYFRRSLVKPILASGGECEALERKERSDKGVPPGI